MSRSKLILISCLVSAVLSHARADSAQTIPVGPFAPEISSEGITAISNLFYSQLGPIYQRFFKPTGHFPAMFRQLYSRERGYVFRTDGQMVMIENKLSGGYLNTDAFALLICHEYGHLYGSRKVSSRRSNLAPEGEADYFATAKCMPLILQHLPQPETNLESSRIEAALRPILREKCEGAFSDDHRVADCIRIGIASYWATQFMKWNHDHFLSTVAAKKMSPEERHKLRSELMLDKPLSIENPSLNSVPRTLLGYPSMQCRLDTMIAGSLCNESPLLLLDRSPEAGICGGHMAAERPRCWYNKDTL